MDRSVIQQRLSETEHRIANGERYIAQHSTLVAGLRGIGRPARMQNPYEQAHAVVQATRRDGRDWLLKQLR